MKNFISLDLVKKARLIGRSGSIASVGYAYAAPPIKA